MSKKKDFIGMGHNPNLEVPDIPTGLGMALYMEADARKNFENLSNSQKTNVIHYVKSNNKTGDDAKKKVNEVVEHLKSNSMDFMVVRKILCKVQSQTYV